MPNLASPYGLKTPGLVVCLQAWDRDIHASASTSECLGAPCTRFLPRDDNSAEYGHKIRAADSRPKAAFDRIVCLIILVALAPLMTLVSLVILCTIGRSILFRQLRTGLNGRRFHILKFHTMRDPDPSWTDPRDNKRVTRLGKLLRLTSLDELPQILNVLRGDMSLIRPRPQLVEFEIYAASVPPT